MFSCVCVRGRTIRLNMKLQQITLSDNELEGTVPSELGLLPSMTVLQVTDNNLSGPLPTVLLETLANLTSFFFTGNKFTGPLPSSLASTK
jgi:Leucine-rich repeat (LRR) protein